MIGVGKLGILLEDNGDLYTPSDTKFKIKWPDHEMATSQRSTERWIIVQINNLVQILRIRPIQFHHYTCALFGWLLITKWLFKLVVLMIFCFVNIESYTRGGIIP